MNETRAKEFGCQSIVFEHLDNLRVPKNFYGAARLRRKVHYWLQGRIQHYTSYKACNEAIRFSRVLFKGSSDEAFEGSGRVRRVAKRQIALFRNEKWYNCDLLVSDKIGALYWIGEIINYVKSLTGNRAVAGHDQMPDPVAPPWSAGLEPYSC